MADEGLCETCVHRKEIRSDRGSVFIMCLLGLTDPAYPKYPRLPVLRCAGYVMLQAVLLLFVFGFAQQPAFEVASVKPSGPDVQGRIFPMTADPERIEWRGVPMSTLLRAAYNVHPDQIVGPDWLEAAEHRFDMSAKIPAGTTMDQFRLMLRNLLVERFHLTLHHEQRRLTVYGLTVARGAPN